MKKTLVTVGLAIAEVASIAMMIVGISGLVADREISKFIGEIEELKDEANN